VIPSTGRGLRTSRDSIGWGFTPSRSNFGSCPHAYDFMNGPTDAARVLNARRRSRRQAFVDRVSIFVRLGYIRFEPDEDDTGRK
jgi:hypothetical protein